MSRLATIRTCASCEWIFRLPLNRDPSCPKCQFGSYGARSVYGDRAYAYAWTQAPWREKKLTAIALQLDAEIQRDREPRISICRNPHCFTPFLSTYRCCPRCGCLRCG